MTKKERIRWAIAKKKIAALDAAYIATIGPVFNRRAVCPDNGGVREADEKDNAGRPDGKAQEKVNESRQEEGVLTVDVIRPAITSKSERAGNSTQR